MEHSFNTETAKIYGIEEAIIIKNLQFWILKNKANEKHAYEGRTWTYNSIKAFNDLFPYMSESKIRRVLDGLVEKGVLIKGNFNQSGYDRTTWWGFQNEQLHLPESTNGIAKNTNGVDETDKPIPDIKPTINPNKKQNWSADHQIKAEIITANYTSVLKLTEPSSNECGNLVRILFEEGLSDSMAVKKIIELAESMENRPNLNKEYKSFYLTCKKWIQLGISRGDFKQFKSHQGKSKNPTAGAI